MYTFNAFQIISFVIMMQLVTWFGVFMVLYLYHDNMMYKVREHFAEQARQTNIEAQQENDGLSEVEESEEDATTQANWLAYWTL